MAKDENPIAFLATLSPNELGMFFTATAVIGGLCYQGAVDRAKLTAYLWEIAADLSPEERLSPYGRMTHALANQLEGLALPKT